MTEIARRTFLAGSAVVTGAPVATARASSAPLPGRGFPAGRAFPIAAKPFWEVRVDDGFWAPKIARSADVTIPFEIAKLKATEHGLNGGVLEAALYTLKTREVPVLRAHVDERVRAIRADPSAIDTNRGFEIAIAHHVATGERTLLDIAIARAAAMAETFRRDDPPFNGGERDALSCALLYRVTGDPAHLALARHWLDIRGRPDAVGRSRHNQSWMPVTAQREAVGHAVNGATLMLSLVDVGVLAGDRRYFDAGAAMWQDAVVRKFYITGGIGQTGNEGFGEAYALPVLDAYAETCAVLMFMTLSHRLFLATGDARCIDVMERGMYNNALSGVSTSGDHFFYVNRLASAGTGRDARWQHAALECCPPNLVRFLATMPGLIYAQGKDGAIYVNLYVTSAADFTVDGGRIGIRMESAMPWAGDTRLSISAATPARARIRLRVPGWARGEVVPGGLYGFVDVADGAMAVSVNRQAIPARPDADGYIVLDRLWRDGDRIDIALPVTARRVMADTRVMAAAGRVAIVRGPIVYCAEGADTPGGRALDMLLPREAPLAEQRDDRIEQGAVALSTVAASTTRPSRPAQTARLIPYHLWANRGPAEMAVWIPERAYRIGDIGPAGGWICHVAEEPETIGWRYLEAAPFDQSLGAQWGCFRREIAGARGTAIGDGQHNTAAIIAACKDGEISAAHLCAALRVGGIGGWFLPSRDELAAMYRGLKAAGLGDFRDAGMHDNCEYWASTQVDADMAAHIDFADAGRLHGDDKDFPRRVRAIRTV